MGVTSTSEQVTGLENGHVFTDGHTHLTWMVHMQTVHKVNKC